MCGCGVVVYMSEKREDLKKQVELLKKSREQAGLNRKEFSEYMGIVVQKANYAVRMYENVGFKTVDENDEEYIMVCEL